MDLTTKGDGTARQNRNAYLVFSRSRPTSLPPMPLPFSVPQTLRLHMHSCPATSVYAMPHDTRALVCVCILPRAWLVVYIDGLTYVLRARTHASTHVNMHVECMFCRVTFSHSPSLPFLTIHTPLHIHAECRLSFVAPGAAYVSCLVPPLPEGYLETPGWWVCTRMHKHACINTRAHMQIHIFMHSFTRAKLYT